MTPIIDLQICSSWGSAYLRQGELITACADPPAGGRITLDRQSVVVSNQFPQPSIAAVHRRHQTLEIQAIVGDEQVWYVMTNDGFVESWRGPNRVQVWRVASPYSPTCSLRSELAGPLLKAAPLHDARITLVTPMQATDLGLYRSVNVPVWATCDGAAWVDQGKLWITDRGVLTSTAIDAWRAPADGGVVIVRHGEVALATTRGIFPVVGAPVTAARMALTLTPSGDGFVAWEAGDAVQFRSVSEGRPGPFGSAALPESSLAELTHDGDLLCAIYGRDDGTWVRCWSP